MLDELIRHPILAARFVVRRIREIPSKGLPSLRRPLGDDFDQKYGVETAKFVQIVATNSPNLPHGVRYSASSEAIIRWCIENCAMRHEETTFVDLGCGKGKALMVASMYSFKRIIGIEYSPELAAICSRNLHKMHIDKRCEVIVGDAVDFKCPDENVLVFLYNPFDSTILNRVLKNLSASPGHVRIAQLGPGHDVILNSGLAQLVCAGEGPAIYEMVNISCRAS